MVSLYSNSPGSTLTSRFRVLLDNYSGAGGPQAYSGYIVDEATSRNIVSFSGTYSAGGQANTVTPSSVGAIAGHRYHAVVTLTGTPSTGTFTSNTVTFYPLVKPVATLIAPTPNATLPPGVAPTFTVQYSNSVAGYPYGFSKAQFRTRRLSDGSSSWNPNATSSGISGVRASVAYSGPTIATDNPWQVSARVFDAYSAGYSYSHSDGNPSDWTDWQTFTVSFVPGLPYALLPSGKQVTLTPAIGATYDNGNGADMAAWKYELYTRDMTLIYASADIASSKTDGQTFTAVYGGSPALVLGQQLTVLIYTKNTTGNWSDSSSQNFSIDATPLQPSLVTPNNGAVIGSLRPTITWQINDPDGDAQTTVEIELYDMTALAYVTGYNSKEIVTAIRSFVVDADLTLNHQYRLRVATKATSFAGYGPYSNPVYFTISNAVVLNVTTPNIDGSTVEATGSVLTEWAAITGGSGVQKDLRVVITDALGNIEGDTGTVPFQNQSVRFQFSNMKNNNDYYVQVTVHDTLGQVAISPAIRFHISYTQPAALLVTATAIGDQA